MAGLLKIGGGKILSYDNNSGHYKPNSKSLEKVDSFLDKLYKRNPNPFDKRSKWRK